MAKIGIDSRQVILREFLSQITGIAHYEGTADNKAADVSELDVLLRSIDFELTPPLNLKASNPADRTISVGASIVNNLETGARKSVPHAGDVIPDLASGTVTLPANDGGTITVTPGNDSILTLPNNEYTKILIYLDENGDLNVLQGATDANPSNIHPPKPPRNTIAAGYVTVLNNAGTIANIGQGDVFQFGSGAGSGGGAASFIEAIAAENISPLQPVSIADGGVTISFFPAPAGQCYVTQPTKEASVKAFAGIAIAGANQGDPCEIQTNGVVFNAPLGLTPGNTVYYTDTGYTETPSYLPSSFGTWSIPVGVALTTNSFLINPGAGSNATVATNGNEPIRNTPLETSTSIIFEPGATLSPDELDTRKKSEAFSMDYYVKRTTDLDPAGQLAGAPIGFDDDVTVVKPLSNGKLIVGGIFSNYDGQPFSSVARLNADKTPDKSFGSFDGGFISGGAVRAVEELSDGSLLLGGSMFSYNSHPRNRFVKLDPNGFVDADFNYEDFDSGVRAIAVQNDGKILVGGNFTSYGSTPANRLIRLNPDGTVDNTFNIGSGFNNNGIEAIGIKSNGKILVGGDFTTYDGNNYSERIIELNPDGSVNFSFAGADFNNTVRDIAIQSDDKAVVVGDFTSYGVTSANRIVRLNTDATVDATFTYGTGFNSVAYSVFIQDDGKILVGGVFGIYNGNTHIRLIRLETNGSPDSTFNIGFGPNAPVQSISVSNNSSVFIGGDFTTYNGISSNYFVELSPQGEFVDQRNSFNDRTIAVAVRPDGSHLIGGEFTAYNGDTYNRIVQLRPNGDVDENFNVGSGFDDDVTAIALQSDGKAIVCGRFNNYQSLTSTNIIRLNTDGTGDATFITGTGFSTFAPRNIAIQNDGKIIVVGAFTSYNGTSANRIVRLNTDGSIDSSFVYGTGFDETALDVFIQNDGKILVSGIFGSYNGTTANQIVRLNTDGSIDTSFNSGSGVGFGFGDIQTVAVDNNDKILIGGFFTTYNGSSAAYIARLNPDGSLDSLYPTATAFNGVVTKIIVQDDNRIVVCGDFTTVFGVPFERIVRLSVAGAGASPQPDDTFVVPTGGFNSIVRDIAFQGDENIIAVGDFTQYGSTINLARIAQLRLKELPAQTLAEYGELRGVYADKWLLSNGNIVGDAKITFRAPEFISIGTGFTQLKYKVTPIGGPNYQGTAQFEIRSVKRSN